MYSMGIILIGGAVAIWQARSAVHEEVESSINMALQLIKLGISSAPHPNINETDWLYRLSALKQTRHLNIQLKSHSGHLINLPEHKEKATANGSAPSWFADLVGVEYPIVEHKLITSDEKTMTLIIQANSLDEITEVWHESIAFFLTICVLVILTLLAVHLVFNKSLQAINTIIDALKLVETGEYRQKLPAFSTLEYDQIAGAINHLTEVLEHTRQQNTALTQHSLKIQEDERQHLSQELHDEFGQSLTAIKVLATTAAHGESDTRKITDSITDICDHLIAVVRTMMKNLHPLVLNELGMKATLEDMVNQWRDRNPGLSISLHCGDEIDYLELHYNIQLFRVIQECLTNINRHAQATQACIELEIDEEDNILLQVSDNGVGCEQNTINSGFGLLGMQERIKSLEGIFLVQSESGQGVTVKASVPIL